MAIKDPHPAYEAMTFRWQRCRDVASGSDAVKGRSTLYLPRPEGMHPLGGEYGAYLARATFFGGFGRTIDGLAGAIFQKAPTVKAPGVVEDHTKDITLTFVPLEAFALQAVREVLITGRYGVLVDMAGGEAPEPRRPYWCGFPAENIVSWTTARRGGDEVLTRVVLREHHVVEEAGGTGKLTYAEQYRELFLDGDVYKVRLWAKLPAAHLVNSSAEKWIASDPETPLRRGTPLPFIPFVFINASSLSPSVEKPPLVDLADIVLSHYRTSADLEHLLHFVGLPTPWASGVMGDGPLKIGSAVAWILEKDGKAGMLEMSGQGATALREHLQGKEKLMATLGARLLEEQPRANETATAVSMRHAGEHAALRTLAQVAEAGLTLALQYHSWWTSTATKPADTGALVELQKDFFSTKLTGDELRSWITALQAEAVSYETFYEALRRGEATRPGISAEQEKALIRAGELRAADDDEGDDAA
jgi:hypothetical protein